MSLQAIAGTAYDRRNADKPTRIAQEAAIASTGQQPKPGDEAKKAAEKVNGALEAIKRYIPTEAIAMYLPFVAIIQDHYKSTGASTPLLCTYLGFVFLTPVLVWLIYLTKAAEAGKTAKDAGLPILEGMLATLAFVIWGASVPGVFPDQQWWLGLVALASSILLPLLESAAGKKPAATDG